MVVSLHALTAHPCILEAFPLLAKHDLYTRKTVQVDHGLCEEVQKVKPFFYSLYFREGFALSEVFYELVYSLFHFE